MSDQPLDAEIKLRAIALFGIGLVAVMLVVTALMWWLSLGLRSYIQADDPPPAVLPEARQQDRPPGPALQSDPIGDLDRMRAEEDAILNGPEWVDEAGGTARLPIDIAIEAVAETQELPTLEDGGTKAEGP